MVEKSTEFGKAGDASSTDESASISSWFVDLVDPVHHRVVASEEHYMCCLAAKGGSVALPM